MQALSVSALNDYLKDLVDDDIVLNNLIVEGEISNFKNSSTGGHWYFTLKDETAQVSCIVFANIAARIKQKVEDGDLVQVRGKLSIFNKRGTYSLQIYAISPAGLGELARAFLELKEKLEAEGLFDPARKKTLPEFPRKIAVLAAPEGAAIHDIISVAKRRDASLKIHLYPTVVQGRAAVQSVLENLALVRQVADYDAVILARGGGSLEDLQAFNDEAIARALADFPIPTISAIGHEVDFTIADFVADLRAPTPSVAAELLVPDKEDLRQKIESYKDYLQNGLNRLISEQYQELAYQSERLNELLNRNIAKYKEKVAVLLNRLDDLNPLRILQRGFVLAEKEDKPATLKGLQNGDIINLRFKDGKAKTQVLEIYESGN